MPRNRAGGFYDDYRNLSGGSMVCSHDKALDGESLFVHDCDKFPPEAGGVHALVVGTSVYPQAEHATQTLTRRQQRRREIGSYTDIEGAALAAVEFARFLRDRYHDPAEAPVRTVRLFLGPTKQEEKTLDDTEKWQAASKANVESALQRWVDDCDGPAQIGIAYFAGHGFVGPDGGTWVYLGESNLTSRAFDAAINVGCVEQALQETDGFSVVITDCCAIHDNRAKPAGNAGIGAEVYGIGALPGTSQLTISATREGELAYAIKGEGTVLSKSLIPLLNHAGRIVQGAWPRGEKFFAITWEPLQEGLLEAMWIDNELQRPVVYGGHPDTGLHRPKPPPAFDVTLVNREENDSVKYELTLGGATEMESGTLAPGQTTTLRKVQAGRYVLDIASAVGQESTDTVDISAPCTIELPSRAMNRAQSSLPGR